MDTITITRPGEIFRTSRKDIFSGEIVKVQVKDFSQVYDGYHTIEELYDHRVTLFIALCRKMRRYMSDVAAEVNKQEIWRSKFHSDGRPAYEGWFVLGIGIEDGHIITYHLPLSRWNETSFAPEIERAHFDGHTSADVLERLKKI